MVAYQARILDQHRLPSSDAGRGNTMTTVAETRLISTSLVSRCSRTNVPQNQSGKRRRKRPKILCVPVSRLSSRHSCLCDLSDSEHSMPPTESPSHAEDREQRPGCWGWALRALEPIPGLALLLPAASPHSTPQSAEAEADQGESRSKPPNCADQPAGACPCPGDDVRNKTVVLPAARSLRVSLPLIPSVVFFVVL